MDPRGERLRVGTATRLDFGEEEANQSTVELRDDQTAAVTRGGAVSVVGCLLRSNLAGGRLRRRIFNLRWGK